MKITTQGRDLLMSDFRVGPVFSLLSGLPGRKKWINRELIFESSGANIQFVLRHFPDADWQGEAAGKRDAWIDLKQREQNARDEKKDKLVDDSGYEFKTVPYDHQLRSFLLARDKEVWGHFHEQGTGKSKIIIDTVAYRWKKKHIDTFIIVAKTGGHITWIDDLIPTHMPDRVPWQGVFYSPDIRPSEYKALYEAATVPQNYLRVIAFPIDSMAAEKCRDLLVQWLKYSQSFYLIDESSKIKNNSAQRTKFLVKTRPLAKVRRIITGTPVTKGAMNLFPQFSFLDPNILGFNSEYTYRAHFCIMGGFEGRQVVGYKNMDELIEIIDGHSDRVTKAECLDLPPKIYKRREFEMAPQQRRLYDAYRKGAIEEVTAVLKDKSPEALTMAKELAVTRALRLHQIACCLTPDSEMSRLEGQNLRMSALMEDIEEAEAGGNKVIVWARFKTDLREIIHKLGKKAVDYFGDTSEKQRPLNVKRFQHDDRIRIFVSHVQTGGMSLSLPAGTAIYHSNTSSLDDRLQSEDRCHGIARIQGDKILYEDIEARRSVDRRIIDTLRKNKHLADEINRDPLSLFMEEE